MNFMDNSDKKDAIEKSISIINDTSKKLNFYNKQSHKFYSGNKESLEFYSYLEKLDIYITDCEKDGLFNILFYPLKWNDRLKIEDLSNHDRILDIYNKFKKKEISFNEAKSKALLFSDNCIFQLNNQKDKLPEESKPRRGR